MASHGTRRSTIMNRRAGRKAQLAYWIKRVAFTLMAFSCVTYFGAYLWATGWVQGTKIRMETSFYAATARHGFAVSDLVIDGRVNLDRDQLKQIVAITPGDPILAADLSAIETSLEKTSWVADAQVERHFPSTLYIKLRERVPLALWQRQGKLAVVDASGIVLSETGLEKFRDLPIIVGEEAPQRAPDLVAMIQAEPDLKARLESAKWIGGRRWDLYLKNGIAVRLPEEDQGQAIARLAKAQKEGAIMDRKIEAIDLRDPVRIVVQTSPGAIESYEAAYTPDKNI